MKSRYRTLLALVAGMTIAVAVLGRDSTGESPAADAGRWYKGNLHTHSLWSDGNDFPEMIAEWYREHGYHFLALSDHNVLSEGNRWIKLKDVHKRGDINGLDRYIARFGDDWVETRTVDGEVEVRLKPLEEFRPLVEERGRFLMIQGEEISDRYENLPIHINATHLQELIKPQGGASVSEVIDNNLLAVEKQSERIGRPIFAHLNHPNFGYAITAEDMAAVVRERYFEVYNGHPSVHHHGDHVHVGVERMWDIANTLRIAEMKAPPLFGLASDDSHNYFGDRGASPGRGWVMVRAKYLTPESIIASLKAGNFYASSGVTLRGVHFDEAKQRLRVDIEPEEGVTYRVDFIGTLRDYDPRHEPVRDEEGNEVRATRVYSNDVGKVLASGEGVSVHYDLTGDELYVRAVVTASVPPEVPAFPNQKKQAWTQPVGWQKWIETPASAE